MKQFRWLSEVTPHVYTDLGDVEKDKVGAALHKAVSDSAVKLARKLRPGTLGGDVACLACLSCEELHSVPPNEVVLCDGCVCAEHMSGASA